MTRKFTFTILAMLFAILGLGAEAWGQTVTWTRVTTVKELTDGGTFIMGYEATAKSGIIVPLRSKDCNATTSANGYFNTGITEGSSTNGTIDMSKVTVTADYEVYITSPASGKINIQMVNGDGSFYGATSGGSTKNSGRLYTSGNSAETNLTPEFSSETNNQFKLTGAVTGQYKYLKYNTSSPRFAFYNSAGSNIVFYKKDSGDTPSAELESIAISGTPTKTTYEAGEEFDPAGLVVTGTYDDESQAEITSGITWEVTPSGALTAGTTSVSVTAMVDEIESEPFEVTGLTVNEFVQTYANTYTSDASLSSVITGSKVKWEGCKEPNGYNALKIAKAGTATITVPAGTKTVHLHMVAWNGESAAVTVKLGSTTLPSITPTADAGVSGSSTTYTIATEPKTENSYYFPIEVNTDEEATLSLTTASNKRAILFGVNFEADTEPSITADVEAIEFEQKELDETVTDSKVISATGKNLTAAIAASMKEGSDAVFSVVANGTPTAAAGEFTVSYSTTEAGEYAGTVVLSSGETSIEIPVSASVVAYIPVLQSIAVKTAPTKTTYFVGEKFDPTGLEITATYDSGDPKDIAYFGNEDKFSFNPALDAALETTNEKVTITYGNKTAEQAITVKTIANTQETAYTVEQAKAIIDANPAGLATTEVYVKGTVSNIVTEWSSQFGNITFDVSEDGQTTGDQFRFYRNFKGANKTKWDSAEECPAVGDDVIGLGKLTKYGSTYEFTEGNYIVSLIRVTTLSINDITVSLGEEISPEIISNVPEAERTITYSVASEDVVKVQDGKLVTVAVGGPVTVTATLTADGYKEATTTFTVEVIKALSSIAVKTAPTTLGYKEGDLFNPEGLVITAKYNDESTEVVTYAGNENKFTFTPSLETALTTGNTSVTITYAGKTTTQAITVRDLYTYNITWKANGEQFATTQVTEGNALVLPGTNPDNVGDMVFQGWINTDNYYDAETAPEYIVPSEIIPTEAMTFYAVYAKEKEVEEIGPKTYSLLPDNFEGGSYSANDGDKEINGVTLTIKDVYKNTYIQMAKNTGSLFNKYALGTKITSVVVSVKTNSVKVYEGSTNNSWTEVTGSNGTYTFSNGKAYFKVTSTSSYAQVNSITVNYIGTTLSTIYTNFCTTVKLIDEDKTISGNITWDGNYTINEYVVTIENGAVLTINGALINTDPENLIIEDGAQLIVNNSVQATVKKNIAEANTRDSKWSDWYTISSPLADDVEFTEVENLIPGNDVTNTSYDLYRLNEAAGMWENSRIEDQSQNEFTTIDKGRGYLYARKDKAQLEFKGVINVADVENVNLTMTADKGKGFNLIGNPFMQNITLDNVTGVTLAGGFYVLSNENTWRAKRTDSEDSEIKPLQGFLVQATEEGGTARISKNASVRGERSKEQSTNIEMIVSNSIYRDNAFAMFGEGIGLNKVNHRNAEAPMLYIPQDGEKFAIAFMDENTTVFPLNFKAMTTGKYSISLKATDDINTLVLVDNMTGVETNMLLENSYSFNGSPADSDGRFTVKLSISHSNGQSDNEHFVYQNGKELVVNGEGTLQIFDVLGRVVISEEVHGQTVYVGNLSEGAYIVRMTGNEIKTQKIIIR